MISYAQNFEDVMLNRVFRDKIDGFYIDVGAADPTVESVTKYFYDTGWSGINIDPNENFYRKLVDQRPRDINLNVALGALEEEREMFIFENIGNSTFVESSRDLYVSKGYPSRVGLVKVSTLARVCRDFVKRPIDFLKIDAEGWEKAVLEGADWDHFRPTLVLVEATEPGTSLPAWEEWEPALLRDYEVAYFDGLNRFYLSRDSAGLLRHFNLPPNIHDDFKPFGTVTAEYGRDQIVVERDRVLLQLSEAESRLQTVQSEKEILIRQVCNIEQECSDARRSLEHVLINLKDTRSLLEAADEHGRALQAQFMQLTADVESARAEADREADLLRATLRSNEQYLSDCNDAKSQLLKQLMESRRWVGQLSQESAAFQQKTVLVGV